MKTRSIPLAGALLLVPVLSSASSIEPSDVTITDPAGLRQAAVLAGQSSDLARLADRVEPEILVASLDGGQPALSRTALSLVPHVKRPAPFLPVLLKLSASRDRDLASRAASAGLAVAGRLDARSAEGCADDQCDLVEIWETLLEAMHDALATRGIGPDVRRQILAILATDLGRLLAPELTEEVLDLLEDPDPGVRIAAATLLAPPPDADALDALLDAAGADEDPAVAATCLVAACAAMDLEEGVRKQRVFEKRLSRLVTELTPAPESTAPIEACLAGLGTEWAKKQAAMLGPPGAP